MNSLRARLMLGLVALVVVGLTVSDVLMYTALERFLLDQRQMQLNTQEVGVAMELVGQATGTSTNPNGAMQDGGPLHGGPQVQYGTFAELVTVQGHVLATHDCGCTAHPSLPSPLHEVRDQAVGGSGEASWYMLSVRPLSSFPPPPANRITAPTGLAELDSTDLVIVAIPLDQAQGTLNRLLLLEVFIGAGVLIGMSVLAWWIIRLSLQPLRHMGETAGAIAEGDLSRRVEPATQKTEIGRLGLALNGMLSQIEKAFDERTRTEQRLRRFIADASHELRTPLTSIRGYAELLRRGAESKPEDADLARRRIEQEAVRMSVLVDDLLLLARLDQGRPLERTPVDLQVIARDAADDARAVAPWREISLTAPGPVVVSGDDLRLRQVVGNLVRNALVHTPSASPVEIAVGQENGHAVFTVTDHGPGLNPEVASKVFEPFYRADSGRSRDRGGSGLGLSIVAAVVGAHGGKVAASKTPGGGATFRVELPSA